MKENVAGGLPPSRGKQDARFACGSASHVVADLALPLDDEQERGARLLLLHERSSLARLVPRALAAASRDAAAARRLLTLIHE